uniref:Gene 28 protein n=1 Tax=Human herpesvirus 8 TaxID=37296 RepID=Q98137_HHV8|nr:gene 28 protein [Human gammaherpesvirus 8]
MSMTFPVSSHRRNGGRLRPGANGHQASRDWSYNSALPPSHRRLRLLLHSRVPGGSTVARHPTRQGHRGVSGPSHPGTAGRVTCTADGGHSYPGALPYNIHARLERGVCYNGWLWGGAVDN